MRVGGGQTRVNVPCAAVPCGPATPVRTGRTGRRDGSNQAIPSPSRTVAPGSSASALPGTMSLPRRLPLPIRA